METTIQWLSGGSACIQHTKIKVLRRTCEEAEIQGHLPQYLQQHLHLSLYQCPKEKREMRVRGAICLSLRPGGNTPHASCFLPQYIPQLYAHLRRLILPPVSLPSWAHRPQGPMAQVERKHCMRYTLSRSYFRRFYLTVDWATKANNKQLWTSFLHPYCMQHKTVRVCLHADIQNKSIALYTQLVVLLYLGNLLYGGDTSCLVCFFFYH